MRCDLFSLLPSVVILDGRADAGVNLCLTCGLSTTRLCERFDTIAISVKH